jgi:hypothetical protein
VGWLPGPRRLRFRSYTTPLTDATWLVHDTTTWEDGRTERRDFLATLVARDRVRLTGAEMPGGLLGIPLGREVMRLRPERTDSEVA